jgi:CTP:molybdopterin cytidylyltransferase MocA
MPDSTVRVCAVLLAAGRGLLAPGAGVDGGVWVVGRRAQAAPWLGALIGEAAVHWVEMPWGYGQGDSVAAGVRALPAGVGIVVALGDQPFAAPAVVGAVVGALKAAASPAGAAVATAGGVRTPPVAFGPTWRARLEGLEGEIGARALLARSDDVMEVALGGGAWQFDLDTQDDRRTLSAIASEDAFARTKS